MHFEILSEDLSGKAALDILVPKIIDPTLHTFKVTSYKGIGRIPKKMKASSGAEKRILLDQLPKLLRGFGKTHAQTNAHSPAAVIVVCDLDDRVLTDFLSELQAVVNNCNPAPLTRFCIAIEEGEAWFLGDQPAIYAAYPTAKTEVLAAYAQDSICGTWETLADAVYPGGATGLKNEGWPRPGAAKSDWANAISPNMVIENNSSPSFQHFVATLVKLAA